MALETVDKNKVYHSLRETMNRYAPISESTWTEFIGFCDIKGISKGENLISLGQIPRYFYFIYHGLARTYTIAGEEQDKEITKSFFDEGRFPASVVDALKQQGSRFTIQALEDSIVVRIDYLKYRDLLERSDELKWYHIQYLEAHWVLEKEFQEISLLGDEGKSKYLKFLEQYPQLEGRVPLYQLASKIGITPTQLSRIRKELKT